MITHEEIKIKTELNKTDREYQEAKKEYQDAKKDLEKWKEGERGNRLDQLERKLEDEEWKNEGQKRRWEDRIKELKEEKERLKDRIKKLETMKMMWANQTIKLQDKLAGITEEKAQKLPEKLEFRDPHPLLMGSGSAWDFQASDALKEKLKDAIHDHFR
ncbi:15390_t:CDS:2, partial [Funneliformis geosporum]